MSERSLFQPAGCVALERFHLFQSNSQHDSSFVDVFQSQSAHSAQRVFEHSLSILRLDNIEVDWSQKTLQFGRSACRQVNSQYSRIVVSKIQFPSIGISHQEKTAKML